MAVSKIDDLTKGLLDLSEQHAFTMRVDPANFKVSDCRDTVYAPILLRVAVTDTDDARFSPRVEFVLRTKICDLCYRLLCSCCPTAFSWWSPPCSPRSSPQRPTAPLINSCAPCPWLSLRNTVELPRGVATSLLVKNEIINFIQPVSATTVSYVSPTVFSYVTVHAFGRVLLPHRALMTERTLLYSMAPRHWDGRHWEPVVVTHAILFIDGFNRNTKLHLTDNRLFPMDLTQ